MDQTVPVLAITTERSIYHFGEFRFDPAARELQRGGNEVPLRRKTFDCLVYLVEHRDRVVGRDELIAAVWKTGHLSDGVLAQTIFEIRQALDDNGEEPAFIKTVRGVGYRWAAPLDTVAPGETGPARGRGFSRRWLIALALAALAAAAVYVWHGVAGRSGAAGAAMKAGEIGLLLPVAVDADGQHVWLRLGLMELIAGRLRAAGQPMVPTDTVIALLRRASAEPPSEPDDIAALSATTGAALVLAARAERADGRWRVSLRSLLGPQPPVSAFADADDVLEAARIAADRVTLSLGRTPAPAPDVEPGLTRLLQQTEAALLAERHDVARSLIEAAAEDLRRHPRVRWQLARIELHDLRLDTAEPMLDALLAEPAVRIDPMLHAQILHDLSRVHFQRGDLEATRRALEAAMAVIDEDAAGAPLGQMRRSLGLVELMHGNYEAAGVHLAQARRALEGTGDAVGLATLDNNLALLEALRERYAEALSYFASAAERDAALHHISSELRNRANMIEAHLGLLDAEAALALEPRLDELLAQTDHGDAAAHAQLAKAFLRAATGRRRDAQALVAELLQQTETRDDAELQLPRTRVLVLRAQWAAEDGEFAQAARWAADAVAMLPAGSALRAEERGRAWLILTRARLASDELDAAGRATADMTAWAEDGVNLPAKIYAALAQAELAAARGRRDVAAEAYERALALAESSHVPLRLVHVARSYVPWLLAEGAAGDAAARDRALVVAGRVNAYAARDYHAALLQARVYHAVGPVSAWRTALAQAQALAGERPLPPELLTEPSIPAQQQK